MNHIIITHIIARLIKWYIWIVLKTSSVTIEGAFYFEDAIKTQRPIIIALWHSQLFLLPLFANESLFSPIEKHVLISKSRDGNIPSILAESYAHVHAIRIGHTSRHHGLHKIIDVLHKNELVFITPDGPRGPRQQVKPGVVFAGKQTQASIFSFTWKARRMITCNSWDRFQIPLPFSSFAIKIQPPIVYSPDVDIQEGCLRLQKALNN